MGNVSSIIGTHDTNDWFREGWTNAQIADALAKDPAVLAKYADIICQDNAGDAKWVTSQVTQSIAALESGQCSVNDINISGFGGFAYFKFHAPPETAELVQRGIDILIVKLRT